MFSLTRGIGQGFDETRRGCSAKHARRFVSLLPSPTHAGDQHEIPTPTEPTGSIIPPPGSNPPPRPLRFHIFRRGGGVRSINSYSSHRGAPRRDGGNANLGFEPLVVAATPLPPFHTFSPPGSSSSINFYSSHRGAARRRREVHGRRPLRGGGGRVCPGLQQHHEHRGVPAPAGEHERPRPVLVGRLHLRDMKARGGMGGRLGEGGILAIALGSATRCQIHRRSVLIGCFLHQQARGGAVGWVREAADGTPAVQKCEGGSHRLRSHAGQRSRVA